MLLKSDLTILDFKKSSLVSIFFVFLKVKENYERQPVYESFLAVRGLEGVGVGVSKSESTFDSTLREGAIPWLPTW